MGVALSGVHGSKERAAVGTLLVSLWTSSVRHFLLAATCTSGTVAAVNDGATDVPKAMAWAPTAAAAQT